MLSLSLLSPFASERERVRGRQEMGSKHSRANNAPLAAVPLLYSGSGNGNGAAVVHHGEATNAPTTQRAPQRGASLAVRFGTFSLSFSLFPYACPFSLPPPLPLSPLLRFILFLCICFSAPLSFISGQYLFSPWRPPHCTLWHARNGGPAGAKRIGLGL